MVDPLERKIYAAICSHDGVKAREIARLASCTHTEVNHWLYASPSCGISVTEITIISGTV